jgi:hypothetical protein
LQSIFNIDDDGKLVYENSTTFYLCPDPQERVAAYSAPVNIIWPGVVDEAWEGNTTRPEGCEEIELEVSTDSFDCRGVAAEGSEGDQEQGVEGQEGSDGGEATEESSDGTAEESGAGRAGFAAVGVVAVAGLALL